MKAGDKVILKRFESVDALSWFSSLNDYVGKEVVVDYVDSDGTFQFDEMWWLQSACEPCSEPVKNERYFLFAYIYQGGQGSLTATNSDGKMPSYEYINQQVKVANRLSCDIGITNIYEFNSKEDYQQFNKKSE